MNINPKLLKIVELAKHGVAGERENAMRMVQIICEREGLNVDDVMTSTDIDTHVLEMRPRSNLEQELLAQICWAFAIPDDPGGLRYHSRAKAFIYKTTRARHIETINAATILLRQFRKERKKVERDVLAAFVNKHHIFGNDSQTATVKTAVDVERMQRIMGMASNMDDVQIRKQIGGGDE